MATEHFPLALLKRLERLLPQQASGQFCVAFSGGLDSTALLHAMSLIVAEQSQFSVRAIHVDHQLQPQSSSWRDHCAHVCAAAGIGFVSEQVTLDRGFPEGVEAAARVARYAAIRRSLQPGETLLTAHHADDQLETLLLALVRGSGVAGLAAMPEIKPFGAGWHLRPMLEFKRTDVEAWARSAGLSWVRDPSNEQARFDRNFLRGEVLPVLRRRWPSVAMSVSRSAAHLAEARTLLEAQAREDLCQAAVERCLDMRVVAQLAPARRRNLLRHWLETQGARMPSTRKLAALENDILVAHSDRTPQACWDDVVVRRHAHLLYCETASELPDPSQTIEWSWSQPLQLPHALGELHMQSAAAGLAAQRLPRTLSIRFRQGGEQLRLMGHEHRSHLKNLLQEARILPWWRNRLPMLYAGNTLIAVADLWTGAEFGAAPGEQAVGVAWLSRPQILAVERATH